MRIRISFIRIELFFVDNGSGSGSSIFFYVDLDSKKPNEILVIKCTGTLILTCDLIIVPFRDFVSVPVCDPNAAYKIFSARGLIPRTSTTSLLALPGLHQGVRPTGPHQEAYGGAALHLPPLRQGLSLRAAL